jgi:hypothetical protein
MTDVGSAVVPLSLHDWYGRQERTRLHHGGWNGARKDGKSISSNAMTELTCLASMHLFDVDTSQTISRGWENHYPKVYHCLSF